MNIGAFAFLNIYGDSNKMNVSDFAGYFHKNHGLAGAYAISILALAGIPITSGFIAKIYLFTAIVNSGFIFVPFLLALLLLMVVALFYYLKILLPLFDEKDKNTNIEKLKPSFSQKFVLITSAIITIILGCYPEIIIELCRFIAYNI
jgi:NADH-quinone oxidoreductase subunit N